MALVFSFTIGIHSMASTNVLFGLAVISRNEAEATTAAVDSSLLHFLCYIQALIDDCVHSSSSGVGAAN